MAIPGEPAVTTAVNDNFLPYHDIEADDSTRLRVVPLSAPDQDSLMTRAAQWSTFISDVAWVEQAADLAHRAAHLPVRAAVLASSAGELRDQLRALACGARAGDRGVGSDAGERRLLWVFTGMGSQWWGMGRELYRRDPVFRAATDEADHAFRSFSGWSVLAEMFKSEQLSRMSSNDVAQPANFVLQVGLVASLRALGVPGDGILGHSAGEIAAAWAAGCLSLQEAALLVYHRSRLLQRLSGGGTKLAVALSKREIAPYLQNHPSVAIASYNAPESLTLAGARLELEDIAAQLDAVRVARRFVPVQIAYHSDQTEPLEAELRAVLDPLEPRTPEKALYSTVLGQSVTSPLHDADYWWRNVRQPVLFDAALRSAIADGFTAYLEIGPHPVLASSIREVAKDEGVGARTFATLRRMHDEERTLHRAIAEMYVSGITVDWERPYPRRARAVSDVSELRHVPEGDPLAAVERKYPAPLRLVGSL